MSSAKLRTARESEEVLGKLLGGIPGVVCCAVCLQLHACASSPYLPENCKQLGKLVVVKQLVLSSILVTEPLPN